jgi:hypothetical protein
VRHHPVHRLAPEGVHRLRPRAPASRAGGGVPERDPP